MSHESQTENAAESARDRATEDYFTGCNPVSDFAPASTLDRFYGDKDTFQLYLGNAVIDHDDAILENLRTTLAHMRDCADVIETAYPGKDVSGYMAEMDEHARMLGNFLFHLTRKYVAGIDARYK